MSYKQWLLELIGHGDPDYGKDTCFGWLGNICILPKSYGPHLRILVDASSRGVSFEKYFQGVEFHTTTFGLSLSSNKSFKTTINLGRFA